jgi:tRNA/tmRNA/rRNA uracil-C5-methylase (TrmA/RlmC/RlmD family)
MARPPKKFVPTPYAYHEEVEVEITTLTNMGQGLGRIDGWVIMVGWALPGELVRVRIFRNDKNFSEGDLVTVLRPAPERVTPRCALFGQCGGCQYQNLSNEAQLLWKQRQVAELLRHMARVEFPVAPVIASPVAYGYRSKITPHFEPDGQGAIAEIGFLKNGRRREIIDVPNCAIATDAINAALPRERAAIRQRTWKRGATLLLRDTGEAVLTDPKAVAEQKVGPYTFEFLAGDFFQNNPFILPQFVEWAVTEAKAEGARHFIDAYCGSGLFSVFAGGAFASVLGIEISESAVARARGNAARNGLTNCEFIAGDAEAIFASVTTLPEETAVLIDPPRKGSDDAFLQQLIAYGPQSVVYVSCNPATQMRDLATLLAARYRLSAVQPFDLFPQTKHLECVVTLRRS